MFLAKDNETDLEIKRMLKENPLKFSFDNFEREHGLVVIYQNMRGFRTNIEHILAGVWYSKCDILILSEPIMYNNWDIFIFLTLNCRFEKYCSSEKNRCRDFDGNTRFEVPGVQKSDLEKKCGACLSLLSIFSFLRFKSKFPAPCKLIFCS